MIKKILRICFRVSCPSCLETYLRLNNILALDYVCHCWACEIFVLWLFNEWFLRVSLFNVLNPSSFLIPPSFVTTVGWDSLLCISQVKQAWLEWVKYITFFLNSHKCLFVCTGFIIIMHYNKAYNDNDIFFPSVWRYYFRQK